MTDQDTFEGLFAQFDEVVESGESPPMAISTTNLTHSRAPSLGTRLIRWLLQGSGVMVIYLTFFLVLIARPEEFLVDTVGLLVIVGLLSPLMGPRPLAHPWRWAMLVATTSALAALVAALAHWLSFVMQAPPLTALVLSLCELGEKTTSPRILLLCALAGTLVFGMARRLAAANPWIETRGRWRPWRRTLGLSALGLLAGLVVGLPILYQVTWSQAWIVATHHRLPAGQPQAFSTSGDLATILTGHPAGDDFQAQTIVNALRRPQLLEALPLCTAYLEGPNPLTVSDLSLLTALMSRCEVESLDSTGESFLWAAYGRAYHNELGLRGGMLATRIFRQTLLRPLCSTAATAEMLEDWGKRAETMVVLKPASQAGADWFFLDHLSSYRPGTPSPFLNQARLHRPLKLFGLQTPWTPASLAVDAERTLAVLIYSYRRDEIDRNKSAADVLAPPYTSSGLFDQPLWELFTSVTDEHPYRYAADDEALLRTILTLKEARLQTGYYPPAPDIPETLVLRPT